MAGGLNTQFESDFDDIFCDEDEFGKGKTFKTARGVFSCACVWDQDTLRTRAVIQQQGLWLGDVLLFIAKRYFPIPPRPDDILIRVRNDARPPFDEHWRVLDVVDAEDVYEISLDKIGG